MQPGIGVGGGGLEVGFWSRRLLKTARPGSYRGFAWRGVCYMGGSIFAQAKVFFFPFFFFPSAWKSCGDDVWAALRANSAVSCPRPGGITP